MTTATPVQQLGAMAAETRWDDLPERVRTDAPGRVLDILGLALAARGLDTSAAVLDHVADAGGREQATAIGLRARVPTAQAALVNGVLAHSLDFDDTHLPSILHPSASVVPAALATAELEERSGRDLLTAVVVGDEVCIRLGMAGYDRAAGQSLFFERGQHATSICGTLGAAAAAARMRGLDADRTAHALGIAASMGSGLIEANRTGGTIKRLHCGWAAHAGVVAADLAQRGVTAPPTVLEGRFGFYAAWLGGSFDAASLTDGLGSEWALPGVHYKPYPANHFTHAVADAALALRAQGVTAAAIESVEIGVPTPVVRTVGEPLAEKRRPQSGYHAKFSAPFIFAAAFTGGSGLGIGHDDVTDERAADPALHTLMDVVSVTGDPWCDERYPAALPAVVTVHLRDGSRRTERIADNRGGPVRPLSAAELRTKFLDNATRAVPSAIADAIVAAAHDLPAAPRAATVLDIIREA